MTTSEAYDQVLAQCRSIYIKKMKDYGPSWRIMRPQTVNDQLFIKAKRIRTLEMTGVNLVGEDIAGEVRAIINYSVMGIIQLRHGFADSIDMSADEVTALYDKYTKEAKELMLRKNHDYGEAWRDMLPSSLIDIILTRRGQMQASRGKARRTLSASSQARVYRSLRVTAAQEQRPRLGLITSAM